MANPTDPRDLDPIVEVTQQQHVLVYDMATGKIVRAPASTFATSNFSISLGLDAKVNNLISQSLTSFNATPFTLKTLVDIISNASGSTLRDALVLNLFQGNRNPFTFPDNSIPWNSIDMGVISPLTEQGNKILLQFESPLIISGGKLTVGDGSIQDKHLGRIKPNKVYDSTRRGKIAVFDERGELSSKNESSLLDSLIGLDDFKNDLQRQILSIFPGLRTAVVVAATTENIAVRAGMPNPLSSDAVLTNGVDNVDVQDGDWILVKDQTTPSQNGIYKVVRGSNLVRVGEPIDLNRTIVYVSDERPKKDAAGRNPSNANSEWGFNVDGTDILPRRRGPRPGPFPEVGVLDYNSLANRPTIPTPRGAGSGLRVNLGNLEIAPGGVSNAHLAGNIGLDKLPNITNAKLAGGITEDKLAGNIPLSKISGNIPQSRLTGNIPESKLAGNIPSSKLAGNIPGSKMVDGAIDSTQIKDRAVTKAKVAQRTLDNSNIRAKGLTEEVFADLSVTNRVLGLGAVETDNVQNNSINTDKLMDRAVTKDKLDPDAIGQLGVPDNSITTEKIVDGAVTDAKLAPDARTHIATANVETLGLADSHGLLSRIQRSVIPTWVSPGEALTYQAIIHDVGNLPQANTGTPSYTLRAGNGTNFVTLPTTSAIRLVNGFNVFNISGARARAAWSNLFDNIFPTVENTTIIFELISTQDGRDVLLSRWHLFLDVNDATRPARTYYISRQPNLEETNSAAADFIRGLVTTNKIKDRNVTTLKIAQSAVTNIELASNAVRRGHIANNEVHNQHIQDNTLDGGKIRDNSLSGGKIATNSIEDSKIKSGINGAKLSANSVLNVALAGGITNAKITSLATSKLTGQIGTAQIGDSAVTTSKIRDGNVTTAKLANGISGTKLADGTVPRSKLIGVDAPHLAPSVTIQSINNGQTILRDAQDFPSSLAIKLTIANFTTTPDTLSLNVGGTTFRVSKAGAIRVESSATVEHRYYSVSFSGPQLTNIRDNLLGGSNRIVGIDVLNADSTIVYDRAFMVHEGSYRQSANGLRFRDLEEVPNYAPRGSGSLLAQNSTDNGLVFVDPPSAPQNSEILPTQDVALNHNGTSRDRFGGLPAGDTIYSGSTDGIVYQPFTHSGLSHNRLYSIDLSLVLYRAAPTNVSGDLGLTLIVFTSSQNLFPNGDRTTIAQMNTAARTYGLTAGSARASEKFLFWGGRRTRAIDRWNTYSWGSIRFIPERGHRYLYFGFRDFANGFAWNIHGAAVPRTRLSVTQSSLQPTVVTNRGFTQ